jgi:hypothetical protein
MAVFDFEPALRNAFALAMKTRERGIVLKGCRFHYSQAVMKNIGTKGLRPARGIPAFDNWLNQILGLPLLPSLYVQLIWDVVLSNPPHLPDYGAQLQQFVEYFSKYWLVSDEFIRFWNHFDNDLSRTTNPAEGYHSGLKATCPGIDSRIDNYTSWLVQVLYLQSFCLLLNTFRSTTKM